MIHHFFVFISATKTLEAQAVQVLQEMSVFFFGLFCFFPKRTAVLGLLMHPGNCKHSPLDNSLGYCYVPVTIASGHEAGIQQPCSENIILLLHSCSNTFCPKVWGCVLFYPCFACRETEAWSGNVVPTCCRGRAVYRPARVGSLQREATAWKLWPV